MSKRIELNQTDPHKRLSVTALPFNQEATIVGLGAADPDRMDPKMLVRLAELGFLPGERVKVVHRGPGGQEPIAVQIGESMFALRAIESDCILIAAPGEEGERS